MIKAYLPYDPDQHNGQMAYLPRLCYLPYDPDQQLLLPQALQE